MISKAALPFEKMISFEFADSIRSYNKPTRKRTPYKKQAGISLIGAIFIMVILSMLGLFMTSLNSMQHMGSALSIQSTRALYAAQSGIEWAAWYMRVSANQNTCPANGTSFTIQTMTVNINNCSISSITEGMDTYNVFDVEVMASSTSASLGDTDYASRTLRSTIIGQ